MREKGSMKMQSSEYTTELKDGMYVRTHHASGKTWSWKPRDTVEKKRYDARNGVSIEKLAELGHSVRVRHFRWAYYIPDIGRNRRGQSPICVPASFKKQPDYFFLANGGYTHIAIKPKGENTYLCFSSECDLRDNFCYAIGIQKALERIDALDKAALGLKDDE